jgi:MoxR-like ATPase
MAEKSLIIQKLYTALRAEASKVIVGQDAALEQLAIALLVRGHVLLEGFPARLRR